MDEEELLIRAQGLKGAKKLTCYHLQKYIQSGKDVDYHKDGDGNTALMWCARRAKLELVKMLVDAKANVNHQNNFGWSALVYANAVGRQFHMDENPQLIMSLLIAARADVRAQSSKERTVLHFMGRNVNHVRMLLDAKASLWTKDADGSTPMSFALKPSHHNPARAPSAIMRLLIKRGTDPDTGFTALMEVARLGEVDSVKSLLSLGANAAAKDKYGTTALDVASSEELNIGTDAFSCVCVTGTTGDACETNIDDCDGHACLNGGECVDGIDGYTCDCSAVDYSGEFCSDGPIDNCVDHACLNSGVCVDGIRAYTCDCTNTLGFGGDFCEEQLMECESNPCMNGVCIDGVFDTTCDCTDSGYTGETCESDIDDCTSSPCESGTCYDAGANSFTCECTSGFTGDTCQSDADDCASSPCENGRTCTDTGTNSYSCECTSGFTGDTCQSDADDCASSPCENGGTCTDTGTNSYSCECTSGFTGDTCQSDADDCASSPCENGGTCTDTGTNSYSCECTSGFTGDTCQSDLNVCASSPCKNNGTCENDFAGGFECDCLQGFYGSLCEDNVCDDVVCDGAGECLQYDGVCNITTGDCAYEWKSTGSFCYLSNSDSYMSYGFCDSYNECVPMDNYVYSSYTAAYSSYTAAYSSYTAAYSTAQTSMTSSESHEEVPIPITASAITAPHAALYAAAAAIAFLLF